MSLKQCFIATRPWSFPVSTCPIIIAAILAHQSHPHQFSLLLALLTWFAATMFHAVANLINTYFDYVSGVDNKKSADDRSLVDGLMTPAALSNLLLTLFGGSVALFIVLGAITVARAPLGQPTGALLTDFVVLCVSGVMIGYVYTGPPLPLKHYALGDVCMLFAYGPVLTAGAYFVLTSSLPTLNQLWWSLPNGLMAMTILHANNTRDQVWDRHCGAYTLPMFLGERGAMLWFIALFVVADVTMLAPALAPHLFELHGKPMVESGVRSLALALPLLTWPLITDLIKRFRAKKFSDLCPRCGQHALVLGALQAVAMTVALRGKH